MSGSITFNVIPTTNRVPGTYVEVTNVEANTGSINQNTLLIGQKTSAGTATANQPIIATTQAQVTALGGNGSMLAHMYAKYRLNDAFGTVYLLPIADNSGGVAGVQTITITGPATAAGTLSLYFAGRLETIGVNVGDTATVVATNIAAQVNADVILPVAATSAAGVVTVTAKSKGVAAADCNISLNFIGVLNNEATPAGLTVTIAQTVAGAGDPDLAAALANLADMPYDFIVTPYTGSSSLTEIENLLNDTTGRWSYLSQLYGGAFGAYQSTLSGITTFGLANNNQHVSILGTSGIPNPAYEIAAAYGATCATSLRADPGVPLQNVQILGLLAPQIVNRFDLSERNTLLYDGISTAKYNDAGQVILERSVTTYQENTSGEPDNSYLDTETLYGIMYLSRDIVTDLSSKFSRCKLVADGTPIGYGQSAVTSQTVLNEVIIRYNYQCNNGYAQEPKQFAANARAVNAGNGTVQVYAPYILVDQLRETNILVAFSK